MKTVQVQVRLSVDIELGSDEEELVAADSVKQIITEGFEGCTEIFENLHIEAVAATKE